MAPVTRAYLRGFAVGLSWEQAGALDDSLVRAWRPRYTWVQRTAFRRGIYCGSRRKFLSVSRAVWKHQLRHVDAAQRHRARERARFEAYMKLEMRRTEIKLALMERFWHSSWRPRG